MNEDEFHTKLLASFKLEAEDHLKELCDGLQSLEKGNRGEVFQILFRAAHSLKGASRAVDMISVEGSCQELEATLASLKCGDTEVTSELINQLYQKVDSIEKLIFGENESVKEVISVEPKEPPAPSVLDNKSIRIGTEKIDRLLHHVEEMLMIKLSSRQQHKGLLSLQNQLNKWSKEILSMDPDKLLVQLFRSRHAVSDQHSEILVNISNQLSLFFETQKEFIKELRSDLRRQTHVSEQDHRVISGMVDSVLDDTKEILMQPFATIIQGFHRVIRDLSSSLGKEVSFEIIGDDIEIDRRILEKLKDPLMHIIRNSLDHGIENPDQRGKKNRIGSLKIETTQVSGNCVKIAISDDGKGIDVEKVKEVAVRDGLTSKSQADEMSDEEVFSLIYQSGVTTRSIVTDISGLGVGLNVVAENVEKLGGNVEIDSKRGFGTTTTINLPLTLSTFRGIHVKISDQEFIIPTHNVQRVLRIPKSDLKTVENKMTIPFDDLTLSFHSLADIVGVAAEEENEKPFVTTLVIQAAKLTVAFGVDQIINEQEVFVKTLGSQLQRVKNIGAATVMEWGKVIPILDPVDMVRSVSKRAVVRKTINHEPENQLQERKSILVAEDSVTSRMLLKNILESAGYKVKSAVDGIEAYSILSTEEIHLLLSDVEMPRMTGFELTEKVRNSEKHKELPVVLCTSLGSKEDRERGIAVGANAYIDKSSFVQSNLLEILEQML